MRQNLRGYGIKTGKREKNGAVGKFTGKSEKIRGRILAKFGTGLCVRIRGCGEFYGAV